MYELALLSVLIGAGYWGVFFVRQRPDGTATFGAMLLAAAALAGLGMLGRHVDAGWLGVAGAIGVGAGACLLVIGPVVRAVARWLVAVERIRPAMRLLDIAELLAPASGVAEEKAVLYATVEIREGRVERTIEALTAAKQRAPEDARLAIDERIAMLYVAAYRWQDAIAHAEAHLFGAPPPDAAAGSLRRALGIAPPVWVELVGAYGWVGDLEQAARMVARLEDVCAGRDDAALWLHRARVMFLALAGRSAAVCALVDRRHARYMTAAQRSYWIAVAHEHGGDRAAAAAAYQRARARTRGRPRELIDAALSRLAAPASAPLDDDGADIEEGMDSSEADGATEEEVARAASDAEPCVPSTRPQTAVRGERDSQPRRLRGVASVVIARVEAAPIPVIRGPHRVRARATWLLVGAITAVSAISAVAIGPIGDLGTLVRAGALVRSFIDAGEWWRLVAGLFVHVAGMHLLLNAVGLAIVGRLAEELFGSARVLAVFGGAGVAGAVASYLASPRGISAGASGAVFGLLGAVFVEITWHRERYRAAWKRGLWGGLAVVTVAQLAWGYSVPAVDQWAHGIGLAAGAALGFLLSPHARWARIGRYLARALAAAFVVLAIVAGALVARTSLADSLTAGGSARRVVAGVAITAPASWQVTTDELVQPDGIVVVLPARRPREQPPQPLAEWSDQQRRRLKGELGELAAAREPRIALPAGWEGVELEVGFDDDLGERQRVRVVLCRRAFGDTMVIMEIQVPDGVASAAAGVLAALIASTAPA